MLPWEKTTPYLIAEIGINHNGDLEIAKSLIRGAKEAGCDAVKFQKRSVEIVYTEDFLNSPRKSPWGDTQRDQKEGLELCLEDYEEIDSYAKEIGIEWFVSCWDVESQRLMRRFNTRYNKIASAMATHKDLVNEIAREGKPTIISTGLTTDTELSEVVETFRAVGTEFCLLHTVSMYPAEEKDLNLRCMDTLRKNYNCPIGYSGHESSLSPSIIAAALGARVIERHITLDRAMYGSDQAASLSLAGISELASVLGKIETVIGDGVRRITDGEVVVSKKLRYWNED